MRYSILKAFIISMLFVILCSFGALAATASPSDADKNVEIESDNDSQDKDENNEAENFATKYKEVLDSIRLGVSMENGNTRESLAVFIESLAPAHSDNITFSVEITDNETGGPGMFLPATAGTRSNPSGRSGQASAVITITSASGEEYIAKGSFIIRAIPYSGSSSSSGGSSGGGGGSSSSSNSGSITIGVTSELTTTGPTLSEGTLEVAEDGTMRFVTLEGQYAQSQWIILNGDYYYVDANDTLVTGWHMIDHIWYYFDDSTGIMVHDTITPDGFLVGSDGAWIPTISDTYIFNSTD